MLELKDFQIGPAAGPDDLTVTMTMTGALPTPPMSMTVTVVVQNEGQGIAELRIAALRQAAKAMQATLNAVTGSA